MASDPRIRASDQDRDRTGEALREHHALGRLDADEFAERLDRVFAAKTIGELDDLTSDLPAVDLYPLPTSSVRRTRGSGTGPRSPAILPGGGQRVSGGAGRLSPAWRAAWGSWLCRALLRTMIWVLRGGHHFLPASGIGS